MDIPSWIDKEALEGFIEMRRLIKKPLTDRALSLALGKLKDFKDAGHDPNAILDQSVFNSWQGLFPIKETNGLQISSIGGGQGRGYIDFAEERQKSQDRKLAAAVAKLSATGHFSGPGRIESLKSPNTHNLVRFGSGSLAEGLDENPIAKVVKN